MSESVQAGATSWTLGSVLQWSTAHLQGKGFASPRLDCELLLAHVLGVRRLDLYLQYEKPLSGAERECFKGFLQRRLGGEPVAYLVGQKSFWKNDFYVDQRVLIPRPETELILEEIEARFGSASEPLRILDIGTGSGCLAISVANLLPRAQVEAWDICSEALAVAEVNRQKICPARDLTFKLKNALDPQSYENVDAPDGSGFHVIVSNPPYVAEKWRASMHLFEPTKALFCGADGLDFYRAFAAYAGNLLANDGIMIMEIGVDWQIDPAEIFTAPLWRIDGLKKDLAGISRVLTVVKTAPPH